MALQDSYGSFNRPFAITPSDTVNFAAPDIPEAIFVGGAGNIACVLGDSSVILLSGCLAGTIYPISGLLRINSTNTTATLLRGLRRA